MTEKTRLCLSIGSAMLRAAAAELEGRNDATPATMVMAITQVINSLDEQCPGFRRFTAAAIMAAAIDLGELSDMAGAKH